MSRRGSTSSDDEMLSAIDSSSPLILVHDEDDENLATPFDFDGENDDMDSSFQLVRPFVQPLTPSTVFLYLLSPFLKLGAMQLPQSGLPLKFGVPALFFFALLSVFSRQVWYMLARYFCKPDLEEIVLDILARGRNNERRRKALRSTTRAVTIAFRLLLAAIYLRECVQLLVPFLPDVGWPSAPPLCVLLSLIVLPFSLAQSLASKRVIYVTCLSVVTYVLWFACAAYSHAKGLLLAESPWTGFGPLWQGITVTAFAFTTSSTLPLYASLKAGTHNSMTTAKPSPLRSFKILSIISVSVAVSLTLPLTFFAASPNVPVTQNLAGSYIQLVNASLQAVTLYLAIPSVLVATPSFPIPERVRRSTSIPISKLVSITCVTLLSLTPDFVSSVISDILLVCTLVSAYFVPALAHVGAHFLRRPLSIIMPTTPNPFTPAVEDSEAPNSASDPLLQRKERAMQKHQFQKRVVWDLGVWLVLLPLCGSGFVWAFGRLFGRW